MNRSRRGSSSCSFPGSGQGVRSSQDGPAPRSAGLVDCNRLPTQHINENTARRRVPVPAAKRRNTVAWGVSPRIRGRNENALCLAYPRTPTLPPSVLVLRRCEGPAPRGAELASFGTSSLLHPGAHAPGYDLPPPFGGLAACSIRVTKTLRGSRRTQDRSQNAGRSRRGLMNQ